MDFNRVRSFIQESKKTIVELETMLTAIPALAPESGGDGEEKKALALTSWLQKKGITDITQIDVPDTRVSCGYRPNLIATIPGADDSKTFWYIAHLDVVPPGDAAAWSSDPWTVVEKDGRLYGRGVEDNQQGLVSSVLAVLALHDAGITPCHTVKLLFAADEENGSAFGVEYLLRHNQLFRPQDCIVIPDGGDANGETIEVAEKNIFWPQFTVTGKQSHGSRPDQGINAHLAGCALALELHDMEHVFNARDELFEPPYSTIQPTRVAANVPNINTIPGSDVFCMDMRILPCYTLAAVRSEIQSRCNKISNQYGVTIDYTEIQSGESPATPVTSPAVTALAAAVKAVTGRTTRPVGIGGGTVGAGLRRDGFLNTVVWSILDDTAHMPNEYAVIENIMQEATVLAAMMCGYTEK